MSRVHRGAPYVALWILALVFGWMEAATVIYLREIYLSLGNSAQSYPFALISLPIRLIAIEVVREGCTLAFASIRAAKAEYPLLTLSCCRIECPQGALSRRVPHSASLEAPRRA